MTLQQLRYVIAVNKCRNFARAAEECSVTQPTLSAMLMKLESELGVRIFERTSKTVVPTAAGEKIILLAEKTLSNAARIHNVTDDEEDGDFAGELRLSIGPTIAPYILPEFISNYTRQFPSVQLFIKDMKMSSMLNSLLDGSIDAGIGIAGNTRRGIKEIPLYTEPVELYAVPLKNDPEMDFMWVMKEALSLRENTYQLLKRENKRHHIYEATSIDELIRLIDREGGSTMIPHMHLRYLTADQRRNVVSLRPEEMSQRTISLYVRTAFERTAMLRSIVNVLKGVIPVRLLSPALSTHHI